MFLNGLLFGLGLIAAYLLVKNYKISLSILYVLFILVVVGIIIFLSIEYGSKYLIYIFVLLLSTMVKPLYRFINNWREKRFTQKTSREQK